MAILSNKALSKIRREVCKGENPNFTKEVINNSLQSIEDYFSSKKSEIGALLPPIGSKMKKKMLAYYFQHKFNQDK